jgi:hypothetical protein
MVTTHREAKSFIRHTSILSVTQKYANSVNVTDNAIYHC